eukprot:Tamp_13616.p1 GENE.Tamp_13616~~Tamp_13616.p1  ORF type:complete len:472 (-),score=126.06 Tamp_13616:287-1588(-)
MPTTSDFKKFQRSYLIVYVCAVMGDWLQGPYVYALYAHYQFSKQQIALLFIFGFGASAVFGTYAGEMADKYGRRLSCYVYCATYIVSCLTKHSPNFYVLLFGRLTGGVATSILFSSFESWLVAEHNKNFYPAEWLSQTLSLATLLNGVTAITAGWLGAMVRNHFDSLVAPFDLAIVFLVGAMGVMSAMWAENKGDMTIVSSSSPARSKLSEAIEVLQKDHKIALIGMIQSCFEASMYIFVFMWTPKLEALFKPLPHGQVFGCFMACSMMGSSLVNYLIKLRGTPVGYLRELLLVSALCLSLPALVTSSGVLALVCFFIFEAACGIYFPSMGIIKSQYVPEEVRATLYNVFRVPLNVIVVVVLANLGSISDNSVFCICGFLLAAAGLLHHILKDMVKEGVEAPVPAAAAAAGAGSGAGSGEHELAPLNTPDDRS